MKRIPVIIILLITVQLQSCITLTHADGSNYPYVFPVTDRIPANAIDTSKYIRRAFVVDDYNNRVSHKNGKRVIVPITGKDLREFAATNGRFYVVPYNPTCVATPFTIRKLDSLSNIGYNIVAVGYRRDYDAICMRLDSTDLAQYPYYTLEDEGYTNILAIRHLKFLKEANPDYYRKYKDDLGRASYLLIEDGNITPIFYDDEQNILR